MDTWRTPSYGGTGSGTTLTIPKPGDLEDGDLLVIAARSQESVNPTDWTPPAGFTRISAAPSSLPNSGARVGGIFVKQILDAATEPASYVLTGPNGRNVGIAVAYLSDQIGAVDVVGTVQYGGSSAAGGVVTFNAHDLESAPAVSLIAVAAECTVGISHVPSTNPSGFTMVGNVQSTLDSSTTGTRTGIALFSRDEADVSIEALTAGYAGASASGGWMASFTGGLEAPPTPMGIAVKLGDGSTAYLSYLNGAGERVAPASVRMTLPPFTVENSLLVPGVTMGHRGASAVAGMPEMARRSYRYAATQRSYRMLEFSTNRTSDGVYVGCHDASLNRTSETTGLADLSAMTWADVQAHMNTLNSAGIPVPYYRLDDFLDEFAGEATVHVDPKFNTGGIAPFLDLLDAHGGPDFIVFKYVSANAGPAAMAAAAKARGYTTAGYFYETDWAAGLVDANHANWDILGLEYTASADAWARTTVGAYPGLRSYGKPVLAHIIPDAAAYATAKAKIEEGGWIDGTPSHTWMAQVRGVDLVAPVS